MGFLCPAGTDGPAQSNMRARQASPVRLGRQHLQALQKTGRRRMAVAGGRIVIPHCGMILLGNDLTLL
jgi:hypothetical protein